jgi:hypothetical protein
MSLVGLIRRCDLCGVDYRAAPEDLTGRFTFNLKENEDSSPCNLSMVLALNGLEADLCPECRKVLIYIVNSRWSKRIRITGGG